MLAVEKENFKNYNKMYLFNILYLVFCDELSDM